MEVSKIDMFGFCQTFCQKPFSPKKFDNGFVIFDNAENQCFIKMLTKCFFGAFSTLTTATCCKSPLSNLLSN